MHSPQHLGLQQHSVGELYPWSIMVRKSPADLGGVVVPVNCLTSYYGPSFAFENWEAFEQAHQQAEQWIRDIPPNPPASYVDAMEELSRLGYPDTLEV